MQEELERAKGEVPTVSLVFKDVTYEQTQNADFRTRLDKALPVPVRKRLGTWNVTFDAAQRRTDQASANAQKGTP